TITSSDHRSSWTSGASPPLRLLHGTLGRSTSIIQRCDFDQLPGDEVVPCSWRKGGPMRVAGDTYETTPDDPDRMVANPAKRKAVRHVREAASLIASAEAYRGQASLAGVGANQEIIDAHVAARAELGARQAAAKALPAKIPLAEIRPGAVRLDVERKRIMDAIRMATYNAESALARMIGPHYARAEDEARSLLHEIFRSPADLEVTGNDLHVTIHPLSAPRRTKALAALCEELNATGTIYPGTELTLVYSVTGI
nr:hypothetical protein [Actinomycetota bacterium]